MKDYRIPVEIVACDPNHYVRCKEMVEAVELLPTEVQDLIDYKLYCMDEEGCIDYAFSVGAHSPAIIINGKVAFQDIVPTMDEMYAKLVQSARTERDRLIIHSAWAKAIAEYDAMVTV